MKMAQDKNMVVGADLSVSPLTEILVKATLDESLQPSLFYRASEAGRPLLVGLHTWSWDRFNQIGNMLPWAEKLDFNLLLPEFRGSNLDTNPNCRQACGSEHARQDVKDAIDYVLQHEQIDAQNIFLLGLSGGGHMALLTAAFWPQLFKAVGAAVPITDLKQWAHESDDYRPHVLACCGSSEEEMAARSPMTYAGKLAKANLKIFHGKYDPVVPVHHSIDLYARIAQIDPNARVFLDIFDGGHEIDMESAMHWLTSQYEGKSAVQVTG